MKKRFVVLLNATTKEQDEAVSNHFKDSIGWWHWLPNSWLLVDSFKDLTATKIRDELMAVVPGVYMVVLEFSDNAYTWAGFGPITDQKNMFKWLKENWGSKP